MSEVIIQQAGASASQPQVERSGAGSTLSGALFISGTAIGAGMLALPFVTGVAGFVPAMAINMLCWLFMLCTGLLFLEAVLWMPDGANVLTLSRFFLGRTGRWIGGAAFVLLYYCLMVAYFAGGVPVFTDIVKQIFHVELPQVASFALFTSLFGAIIYFGTKVTDRLNFILMMGLIVSYIALVGTGSSEVSSNLLKRQNWSMILLGAPTLFSAYGYHNIVPSMSSYLRRDGRKLRWAIAIGTFAAFIVYSIWQWLIIGTLSEGQLAETLASGQPIAATLEAAVQNRWIPLLAQYFSFFALVTSMMGVALSLVDFIGDGAKVPREKKGSRLFLVFLVFIPPLFFAWCFPGLFFTALRYAGGFGEAILNGLFPVLMVWLGRYKYKFESEYRLPGGKVTLALLFLVAVCIIGREVVHLVS